MIVIRSTRAMPSNEFELHYAILKRHLTENNILPKRSPTKTKLNKLQKSQFTELLNDVTDEITRRKAQEQPFLPIIETYHPKRNQARQKLATLADKRFADLVCDLFSEVQVRSSRDVLADSKKNSQSSLAFSSLDNLMENIETMIDRKNPRDTLDLERNPERNLDDKEMELSKKVDSEKLLSAEPVPGKLNLKDILESTKKEA